MDDLSVGREGAAADEDPAAGVRVEIEVGDVVDRIEALVRERSAA